jgi:hypothetical protein
MIAPRPAAASSHAPSYEAEFAAQGDEGAMPPPAPLDEGGCSHSAVSVAVCPCQTHSITPQWSHRYCVFVIKAVDKQLPQPFCGVSCCPCHDSPRERERGEAAWPCEGHL